MNSMSESTEPLFEGAEAADESISEHEFEPVDEEYHGSQQKQFRDEYPSGIAWLTKDEGRRALLEFALDEAHSEKARQFTKTQLAEEVGVSRKTIYQHIDSMREAGVVAEVGDGNKRYRVCKDSNVLAAAAVLNQNIVKSVESHE